MKIVGYHVLFSVLLLVMGCEKSGSYRNYHEFSKAVNALEEQQLYDDAIELTKRIRPTFPEKEFQFIKELEYLYDKKLQYDKNLALWEEGHRDGYFFLLNTRMARFKPYLQFSQFDSLAAVDARLRAKALETSKTIYKMYLPERYDPNKNYPLIMLLHGGGSSLEKAEQRWRLLAPMKSDYVIVFLQSYLHYDSETYGWRSGDQRAHDDIRVIYRNIVHEYAVDTSRVIIGGTSAGGTMAFDLAFNGVIPVQGVIGFCPGRPAGLNPRDLPKSGIKIYMVGGETDFYLERQKELAALFDEQKIAYIHTVVPGMGHEFPVGYEDYISAALEFISGRSDI